MDLGLTSALALCALGAGILAPDGSVLRIALAGPLVLILPGYAVSAGLLRSGLGLAERLALSLGLSLALAVCSGLVLNVTPWGLTTRSWLLSLVVITIVASLWGAYQRATDAAFTAPFAARRLEVRLVDVGLLGIAALIGAAALWFSSSPPPEQPNQAYAVLWAVPDPQSTSTIHLGVQNMEPISASYVLRVERYDQTLQEFALQLEPTQTWETDLLLQSAPGDGQVGGDLQAVLYRADAPDTPFRQAVIRVSS